MSLTDETSRYYRTYEQAKGDDRNALTNPGVLFQVLASEAALVEACRAVPALRLEGARVLEVGCGMGLTLPEFVRLGLLPEGYTGIDLQPDRLALARRRHPSAGWLRADGRALPFPDGRFDVVFESTLFMTLTSASLRRDIAAEMLRACRPGGFLVLRDWRFGSPWSSRYAPLSRRALRSLFAVGGETRLVAARRGALAPPIGRALSAHLPFLYFPAARLLPVLAAQVVYVLEKTRSRSEPAS